MFSDLECFNFVETICRHTTPMFVNLCCFAGFFLVHGLLEQKTDTPTCRYLAPARDFVFNFLKDRS